MDNLDNNAWVFDSLVGFLHGPVWNIPLQTFIEEKSLRKYLLVNTKSTSTYVANNGMHLTID